MIRPFLARFRGKDARSLARALAVLMVVNACFGAFHAGSMAGAPTVAGLSLCTVSGASEAGTGAPAAPGRDAACICCMLGCGVGQAPAVFTTAAALPFPAVAVAPAPPNSDAGSVVIDRPASAGPRGPPVLA